MTNTLHLNAKIIIFLLQGFLSVGYGQSFTCTEIDGVCDIGTFPDPESCAHYYYCTQDVITGCVQARQHCPEFMAFHKDLLQCVLAIDAECDIDGDSLVFVGKETQSSLGEPLDFDMVKTVKGNQWNATWNMFTVAESHGVYFIGLSVGTMSATQADYRMVLSGQDYGAITRSSTAHNSVDTIGRDIIAHLFSSETVHVASLYTAYGNDNYLRSSLTIYSISNSMTDSLVAFSVARTTSFSGYVNPVTFEDVLFNDGIYYDEYSHTFWPPSDGIYFFSFSVGLEPGEPANFTLYKDDKPFASILRASTSHTGTDTIGRSVMMQLARDEPVYMVNDIDRTVRSTFLRETSFSGFKYEPRVGTQIAWSVARTTSVTGVQDPVQFDTVLVEVGGAWQTSSNSATIPRTGYYFFHLGTGIQAGSQVGFTMKVNSTVQLAARCHSAVRNGIDTTSRSGILHILSGSTISTELFNFGAYSDSGIQLIFIGFLLY